MRKQKKWLLPTTVVLLTVMLLTTVFAPMLSATGTTYYGSSPYVNLFDGDVNLDESQYYSDTSIQKLPSSVDDDEIISIIVQMAGMSLLDAYDAKGENISFSEYAKSEDAEAIKQRIMTKADGFLGKLKDENISYKLGDLYDTLFPGFEIMITAGDFEETCKVLGDTVTVLVGEVYNVADTQLVENKVNVFETGIFDTTGFGYDGTGMVIAVLDTGLDYYHDAFSTENFTADRSKLGLTFAEIENLIADTTASTLQAGLTASDVYISEKVPFAFDYADDDSDVYPIQSEHGTHVAGIIAGKDDTITGVAVNAQLAIMKTFSDTAQSAKTSWILSALEDCVVLGVDVINMSLGTSCGFSRASDEKNQAAIYESIRSRGISLIVAASNDSNSTSGSQKNGSLGLTSNPDSATVGSPSTYESSLSVASISGVKTSYLLHNGKIIYFIEANDRASEEKNFVDDLLADGAKTLEIEYVTIPGAGRDADYLGLDVKGKIALVRRGSTTFEEKANTAEKMGAAGVIIYNNVSGDIRMTIGDAKLACCSISQDDGEVLAATPTGTIKISRDQTSGPFMSDFSSWGPTPDLGIKPEITAHGGSILSAVPGQSYDRLSGTSMASPNVAGLAALLRQYVMENFSEDVTSDPIEVTSVVNRLMMSTADIVINKNGLPYSVRKQGAGLVNLLNCSGTGAYILTYDRYDGSVMSKSKIELGDDPERTGVYTLKFSIDNFGNSSVSYDLSAYVMTEGVSETKTSHGDTTVTQEGYILGGANVVVSSVSGGQQAGNTITVAAGKVADVTVTITLSDSDKKYLDDSFANGMYVEGFLVLDAENENTVDLNVPYLAFYGDWTEAPIFDIDYFETNKDELDDSIDVLDKTLPDAFATTPVGGMADDYISYLGSYHYQQKPGSNMISADRKYCALTNQEDGINTLRYIYLGALRNASKVVITITEDATGEVVKEITEEDIRKSFSRGSTMYPSAVEVNFDVLENNLKNNTAYTVTVKGYLDYENDGSETNKNNTFVFPFVTDFEAPVITGCEFYTEYDKSAKKNRLYAKVAVYDNHYAMSGFFGVIDYDKEIDGYNFTGFDRYMTPVASGFNTESYIVYELTDYIQQIKANTTRPNTFSISIYDYATNHATYDIALPAEFADMYFEEESITLSPNELYSLSPKVYPGSEWAELLNYTSTNSSVATVVNGKLIALAPGKTVIYATAKVDGVNKSCALNVTVLAEGEEGYKRFDPPVTERFDLTGFKVNKAFYMIATSDRDIGLTDQTLQFVNNNYNIKLYPSESVTILYDLNAYFPDKTTVAYESSNSSIVTVDENGTIVGVKEGFASISVKVLVDGKSTYYTKSISIEVKDPYKTSGPMLANYYGNGGLVVIPESLSLTSIGQYAFSNYHYIPKDENDVIDEDDPSTTKIWYIGDDTIEEVVIPEGVTDIMNYAFANLTNLKKVTLPSTIERIDYGAFEGCTSLTTIVGIENVKFINQWAFKNTNITGSIALNNAVALANYSFSGNKNLTSVTLSANTQSIGAYAFENCVALENLVINAPKLKLGEFVFTGCESLKKVHINASVIPDGAFNDCKKLEDFTIGKDVAVIGENAFRNTAITSFKIESGNTAYYAKENGKYLTNANGDTLLLVAPAIKGTLTINSGITTIGAGAFSGNTNIREISIPSVTVVEDYAFADCSELKKVTLGALTYIGDYAYCATAVTEHPNFANVAKIGDYAFAGTKIIKVTIPDNVTVGKYAFDNCLYIAEINIGDNVVIEKYAFAVNRTSYTTKYYVIDNKTTIHYFEFTSNLDVLNIGENVTIGEGAFMCAAELKEIKLGAGAKIGQYAFYNADSLEKIDLSKAIEIGDGAFYGDGLYEFTSESMSTPATYVGEDGLTYYRIRYYAANLKEVDLSSAIYVGANAFTCNDLLTKVTLGADLKSIGNYAFARCSALTDINLDGIEQIGEYAFYETNLSEVSVENATSIGKYAFMYNNDLTTVTLGELIGTVGEGAFAYCEKLAVVNGIENITTIEAYAFASTAITEANLSSATSIGDFAFMKEVSTEFKLTLNENIEYIGENPFAYCVIAPFESTVTESFNGVDYSTTIYTFDLGDFVKIINGSIYKVVKNGYVLVSYCGNVDTANIVEGTVRISDYAFAGTNVKSVILPYTLKSIGHKAFYECNDLVVVSFSSFKAPILEETYDLNYFVQLDENGKTNLPVGEDEHNVGYSGLGLVDYFMWNVTALPSNCFYGATFVNYVGKVDSPVTMVKPVNGVNYDSFVFNQYFTLTIDGAAAADDTTLAAIAAIEAIPAKVALADKNLVVAARSAYDKISLNEQRALVYNYQKLTDAEKRISDLEYLANENKNPEEEPDPIVDNNGLDAWVIALIVIGSIAVLGGAAIACYVFIVKNKIKNTVTTNNNDKDEASFDCNAETEESERIDHSQETEELTESKEENNSEE